MASVRRPRTKWPFKHAERRAALRSSGGPPAWANPQAPKSPSRYAAQNTAATVAKTGLARAALQKTPHTTARPSSSNVPPRQNIHSRYRGTRRVPLRRPLVANKPRHFGKSIGSHRLSERKDEKKNKSEERRSNEESIRPSRECERGNTGPSFVRSQRPLIPTALPHCSTQRVTKRCTVEASSLLIMVFVLILMIVVS